MLKLIENIKKIKTEIESISEERDPVLPVVVNKKNAMEARIQASHIIQKVIHRIWQRLKKPSWKSKEQGKLNSGDYRVTYTINLPFKKVMDIVKFVMVGMQYSSDLQSWHSFSKVGKDYAISALSVIRIDKSNTEIVEFVGNASISNKKIFAKELAQLDK